jgi:hypothetical protein
MPPHPLEVGDLIELGHGVRPQIGKAEQHRLDAGATEIAGFDRRRSPTQTALKAQDD